MAVLRVWFFVVAGAPSFVAAVAALPTPPSHIAIAQALLVVATGLVFGIGLGTFAFFFHDRLVASLTSIRSEDARRVVHIGLALLVFALVNALFMAATTAASNALTGAGLGSYSGEYAWSVPPWLMLTLLEAALCGFV